mmetsp:Transcript_17724/g.36784  ORF Transcript_17724/g.36784 Transcript_17724/m.36784 type:complete len:382 (+) Transcript_17724:90-1235(+)
MGIKGLTKLLADHASGCMVTQELKNFFGRKVAIDASMSIYQFLVAVRSGADNLVNESGEITSHLSGLFYRTIKLLEYGVKPCYVFDGKPPALKSGELAKRRDARDAAEKKAEQAAKEGDQENLEKFSRRVNKVTPEMMEQCKTLLNLMGVPVITAPCEAEAQCAELARAGVVYATVSEDMDSLTFGTPRLIRYLWASASSTADKKGTKPLEFHLDKALLELNVSNEQFVDLCILLGCDYTESIKGMGPAKAMSMIRKHGSIEEIYRTIEKEGKLEIPNGPPIQEVRGMFLRPDVIAASEIRLQWNDPDEEGLIYFMVHQNQFREENIRSGIARMKKSKDKANQGRIDTFFTVKEPKAPLKVASKRKVLDQGPPKKKGARTR